MIDDSDRLEDWERDESIPPVDVTVADLTGAADDLPREHRALTPVKTSLEAAGYYAYGSFDDQQRWTIAVDDEAGRVDVRVGEDGFVLELWVSSPGLYSDEENEWRRRARERLARMTIPSIARGMLEPHQSAYWDEVDQGVAVRVRYELPFTGSAQVGAFVREHLPELEEILTAVESRLAS